MKYIILLTFILHWRITIYLFDNLIVRFKITKNTMSIYRKLYKQNVYFKINFFKINDKNNQISVNLLGSKITVIVAGPYVEHMGFTLNSIERVRTLLPSSKIIYSTDSNLSSKTMAYLGKLNIEILINERLPFEYRENNSANLLAQITNVVAALKTITNSVTYVLRVRSDQLILNREFINNLILYKELFDEDNKRIIKLSMNSYINRSFSTSDMFMFGKNKLMIDYWDINEESIYQSIQNLLKINLEVFPEAILDSLYFKKIYGSFPKTYNDYLELIRDQYLIVDESYVGIAWYKEELFKDITLNIGLREITHLTWLKLYLKNSIEH